MKHLKNNLILLLAAFIWGCAFVAQSVSMDYIGPFTFNAVRTLIGGIVLLPVIFVLDRKRKKDSIQSGNSDTDRNRPDMSWKSKKLWLGGISCGIVFTLATNVQQIGICSTTVGKAGFITALYIVIVPVMGIFLRKKIRPVIWFCVAMSVAGLYLLCMTGHFYLSRGDLLVLLCAFLFSIHILIIDHFSPLVDGVKMSCIQFFTCGITSAIPMFICEKPEFSAICSAYLPILYAGIMSCGVAYTLQIIGQKDADPAVASLLLSLESVFSVLAGWVILGQTLNIRELTGCILMFAAIILAQLPEKFTARLCPWNRNETPQDRG